MPKTMRALPTKTTVSQTSTAIQWARNHAGSASMPTDVKNNVTKSVRRDPTSARIWEEKGDSASSIPARNAPRAGESPRECAAQAEPNARMMASNTTSSRSAKSPRRMSSRGMRW